MESYTTPSSYFEVEHVMFGWLDFTLFAFMLGFSALIGIYYGFYKRNQNTTHEYLLGGKSMKVFPVAMSLIASHTSAITLLSVPADIYKFGAVYVWTCAAITFCSIITSYIFMPVFMNLQITSIYEYLSMRFDRNIHILASFLVVVFAILFNPVVIYIPALAFAQATGIHLYWIIPILCVICIFYTTIGGLKTVVWTDTFQTLIMAFSLLIVFYLGITSVGGVTTIWDKSIEGNRINVLDFELDPTRRNSFWAIAIGSTMLWLSNFSVHQSTMQRFMSVPSLSDARKTLWIFCGGIIIIKLLSTFTGLVIYTKYADCDLVLTKVISKNDQLLPYYVMDVASHIPGLPGIFIAGVFSAGLSSLSTSLNAIAGIIYADFLSPFLSEETKKKHAGNILKVIVLIFGTICTLLVFVVEHLGGILALVIGLGGITGGPLLGLFCLGMFFPIANTKGALFGGIGGLMFSSLMVFGNKYYESLGMLEDFSQSFSTDGCSFHVNTTTTSFSATNISSEKPFYLFRITFWYYTFLGTLVTVLIGLLVSWFTKVDDHFVDPNLLTPLVQSWYRKKLKTTPNNYLSVEKAIEMTVYDSKNQY